MNPDVIFLCLNAYTYARYIDNTISNLKVKKATEVALGRNRIDNNNNNSCCRRRGYHHVHTRSVR
jgi:hypothetical protein